MKAAIDARWAEEVGFLKALIRLPSDNPPGDTIAHAEETAKRLEALGFQVERHPVPEPFVKQHGMRNVTNLIVREKFGEGTGPTIALNAHGDAVPPGEGWTSDPYGGEEINGAIYGRGAAVSKSDFATYTFALLALKDTSDGLNGTVELHLTYDEEAGGFVGPRWLLEQGLSKPDYAISAGFSHAVTTAHNGCLHLEIVIRGRQAHAATPENGADALEAATPVLAALYEERKRLHKIKSETPGIGSPQLTVGLIEGGINTNVVPDRVTLRVDRRLIPEEDGDAAEEALKDLIETAAPDHESLEVECRRIMLADPMRPISGTERLAEVVKHHAGEVLCEDVRDTGIPLYTDARHYTQVGIPTVLYGAGPRSIAEANAHGADEHIMLADLRAATEVITLTLKDMLSG
ncbi:ArgE/DapE family deacylase [Rhizobiales bacterium]|uniref:ArgE/DapE family deacylase n=1 Tax=Hongsoonwoonella zoysiae TaxID=2821844 RepID=UPI001560BCD4|nr:ArgE/DapE family deacylase [Hongsoonwoonella zoysiae]